MSLAGLKALPGDCQQACSSRGLLVPSGMRKPLTGLFLLSPRGRLEGSLPSPQRTQKPGAGLWSLLVFFLQNMLQGDSVQSLVTLLYWTR